MKLSILTKNFGQFSDKVSKKKIDFTVNVIHRDQPPAWEFQILNRAAELNFHASHLIFRYLENYFSAVLFVIKFWNLNHYQKNSQLMKNYF